MAIWVIQVAVALLVYPAFELGSQAAQRTTPGYTAAEIRHEATIPATAFGVAMMMMNPTIATQVIIASGIARRP